MERRLDDCLNGCEPNYLFPFFQQYDLPKEDILEELDAIAGAGIRGFCIENRDHTDFAGESWWSDMRFILEEAKKRGMQVWLEDDARFPTGMAAYSLCRKKNYPLRHKTVGCDYFDVAGPLKSRACSVESLLREGETVVRVIAYRRFFDGEGEVYADPADLTDRVRDGLLFWDIPEGQWRVFVIFRAVRGNAAYAAFIDMLDPVSCDLMISEVYEPHYRELKEYFGTTLCGFFSDEPCFFNFSTEKFNNYEGLGDPSFVLPWREDLLSLISREKTDTDEAEAALLLPSLWCDIGGKTPVFRRAYMDVITKLYRDNFCRALGKWCADHGVLYTGHLVEDSNSHFRLACGAGHFFRAIEGQHTSGFDVVGNQIAVGNYRYRYKTSKTLDPRFYLRVLGRLAVSAAYLFPHMAGRVVCECAGANGWSEGLCAKKRLLDVSLVSGGNIFIPAVFSPKRDNFDCPPFVYDRGENPQYPHLAPLMAYVDRLCHLLSGGVHCAQALIFYNAEGEWCGEAEEPDALAAALGENHVDYEFAPWDLLRTDAVKTENGIFEINGERFFALLVPPCRFLPAEILRRLDALGKDAPVFFIDSLPASAETRELFAPENARVMTKTAAAMWFVRNGYRDIGLDGHGELLHIHVRRGENRERQDVYLFVNFSLSETFDETVCFGRDEDHRDNHRGDYIIYDAWNNRYVRRSTPDGRVRLTLPPGTSAAVCFGEPVGKDAEGAEENLLLFCETDGLRWEKADEDLPTEVEIRPHDSTVWEKRETEALRKLRDLAPELPRFSGQLRYRFTVPGDKDRENVRFLDLGEVGESAEVRVNGIPCGITAAPPHRFDLSGAWKPGDNLVEVTVASNCGYFKRKCVAPMLPMPPTGLLGPIRFA